MPRPLEDAVGLIIHKLFSLYEAAVKRVNQEIYKREIIEKLWRSHKHRILYKSIILKKISN